MSVFHPRRPRHRLLPLLVLLLVSTACSKVNDYMAKSAIEGRVRTVLTGIQKSDMSDEYQDAVRAWGKGVEFAGSGSAFDAKENAFRKWFESKGLRIPVQSAALESIEVDSRSHPYSATVTVTLNDRSYDWWVEEGELIAWDSE